MGNHFHKTHPFQRDQHNVVQVDFFAPSTPPSQVGLEAWKNSDAEDAKGPNKNQLSHCCSDSLGICIYSKNPLFSKLVELDMPVLSKTLKYKTYLLMIHIHDGQQIAAYLAIATYPRSYCSLPLAPPHLPHPPRAFVPLPKNASNPVSCCVEAQKGDSSVAVNSNWPTKKNETVVSPGKKPEFCTAADIEKWWI